MGRRAVLIILSLWLGGAADNTLSLEELLSKHREALGGTARIQSLRGYSGHGLLVSLTLGPEGEPFTMGLSLPDRLIFNVETPAGKTYGLHVDGTTGRHTDPEAGFEWVEIPTSQTYRHLRVANIVTPLVRIDKSHMSFKGKKPFAGREMFVVKVEFENGDTGTFYLDKETYLIDHVVESWKLEEATTEITRTYSEYRWVDGVRIPHRVLEVNPVGPRTFRYAEISLESPVDQTSRFKSNATPPATGKDRNSSP